MNAWIEELSSHAPKYISRHIGSLSTEAETLLKALRNVIVPFVHPADGESKHSQQLHYYDET
jgi:hypothetical protein